MPGGVYDVFQTAQFSPLTVDVPAELQGATLKLKPSDGEAVELAAETACMAEKLKSMACLNGPDVVIELPVKKATLSKMIEYMKYHVDTPPAEVPMPLVSDNIAECGVSKWDASFVKMDKDALFELMYAAGTVDIQSLTFLCCIQVSLMMKGKSGDKLRKDFNLVNDLPSHEEESLYSTFGDMLSQRRFPPQDEGALDTVAAVLHGVHMAAEQNGGLVHGASEEPQASSINIRSWRANTWRAVVMQDWQQLYNAPDEVRMDRELLFTAVEQSRGMALHFAADSLKADTALVMRAACINGDAFEAAADTLKSDRDFVLEVITAGDGSALKGASEELRRDRELVLTAASRGKGAALQGAAEPLRADERFVLEVVTRDPAALRHASEEILANKDFMLVVARRNGLAVQYMPEKFRADRDVAAAAVGNNEGALPHVHAARRSEIVGPDFATLKEEKEEPWPPRKDGPMHVGVPLTAAAREEGWQYVTVKSQKYIMFTALSTITPNMGQANYIAANAYMDKVPFYSRPEMDTVGIMWGTVGGMGMRYKAFASQDFMNLTPHLLLSIDDCCKILHMVATRMETPEWFAANFFDEGTRAVMLAPTAGMIRGETVGVAPAPTPAPAGPDRRARREAKEAKEGKELTAGRGDAAKREALDGPLGGWPRVARAAQAERVAKLNDPGEGIYEGAQVVLTGIKNAMNGAKGTVLQYYPEGKCRVALDNGKGNALLKAGNLQVVVPAVA